MKRLIYTIICFKCILQITEGSPYQKYIKLFARLLILCICCGMIIQVAGNVKKAYEDFEVQWNKTTSVTIDDDDIKIGTEYYEDKIMEYYEEVDTIGYETDKSEAEACD